MARIAEECVFVTMKTRCLQIAYDAFDLHIFNELNVSVIHMMEELVSNLEIKTSKATTVKINQEQASMQCDRVRNDDRDNFPVN